MSLRRAIYRFIPFKKEIYTLLKRIYKPKIYKYLYFIDVFKIRVSKDVSFKMKHWGFLIETQPLCTESA